MSISLAQAFLFSWVFWTGLSLGCFALLLLHNSVKGRWGLSVLRIWEAGAKMLPLWGILFIVAFAAGGLKNLYPWTHPQIVAADPVLIHKKPYLNESFFLIRAVLFFGFWSLMAWWLSLSSVKQDKTGDASLIDRRSFPASMAGVFFFFTMTFAFTDWVMSLDKHWYSTIFPAWFIIGQCLNAAAFTAIFIVNRYPKPPYTDNVITSKVRNDLGNLMLVFTMFWAYFTLSQFLIQWSGNLPEEVSYFYTRTHGGWLYMGTFICIFQFLGPFLLLLSGRTKKTPQYLRSVGFLIFFTRIIDVYWTVMPMFAKTDAARVELTVAPLVYDVPMFLVFGVVWFAVFGILYKMADPLPHWTAGATQEELQGARQQA